MAIEDVLQEIEDVFNNDLVPHTFEMNGWDVKDCPKLTFGDIDDVSLDEFSKAYQRIASTSGFEIDRPILNKVREVMGVAPRPDDEEVDWEAMPAFSSRASDGMSKSSGNGTSDKPAGQDNSAANTEN